MSQPVTDQHLSELAQSVARVFTDKQLKLATAESCTGGWVAKLMTEVAGSSAWFDRGFVTYSNEAKSEMLGIPLAFINEKGAVSAEVVGEMTAGALQNSKADWTLSISGIAGPDGGSPEKPVGTVWFAWQSRGGEAQVERQVFPGDRDAVRRASCDYAIKGLLSRIR